MKQLTDETVRNSYRYIDFIDGNGRVALLNGLSEYINDKIYDTSFGDLVPVILTNALSVNLLIVENNGVNYDVHFLKCNYPKVHHPNTLIIYKIGSHYDSIISIIKSIAYKSSADYNEVRATDPNRPSTRASVFGIKCKWDLPVIINVNARSLNMEKVEELQVIVDYYDVSIACITETWFKDYMGSESLSLDGFCLERKDRDCRRGGGVACYIRNGVLYNRLCELEDCQLEVLWVKIMPKRLSRKFSCILVGCIYFTQQTDFIRMRQHIIECMDAVIRRHPYCGVILTGDFNQLNDSFLKKHYRFIQVVNTVTRAQAILDKIWMNMEELYSTPVSISELGRSDHNMILFKPKVKSQCDKGHVTRVTIKCMGVNEKENFASALSKIRWEPLYRRRSCEEKYVYYHTIIAELMKMCFPSKCVTRHTADKPWITDSFRLLIRKRQKAYMCGDLQQYRVLRNKVNRVAVKLKFDFYQQNIEAMTNSGSRVWWKHMKKLMGLDVNSNTCIQSLANKTTDGDCCILANKMNYFFLSVTEHLPRSEYDDQVFTLNDELPDQYVINVMTTLDALQHIKTGKATGPDNIPAWVLKDHAYTLASPLTAIFNSSLREGVLPQEWKKANAIPLPKANPPMLVEKDIRPVYR